MNKYILIVLSVFTISFAQATIPPLSEIANFTTKSFPDDSIYKNKTLILPSGSLPSIFNIQNIGDFDGDGSEEIYISWIISTLIKAIIISSGESFESGNSLYQMGVYSVKKKMYLIKSPFDPPWNRYHPWPDKVATGDFTGDGCVDFLIGDKVYSTTTPIKKKTQ